MQAALLAMFVCFLLFPETGLTAPAPPNTEAEPGSAVALGGGTYRVTASVFAEGTDGQAGTIASSGKLIQLNDNLVALPGCTESSCPWVPVGTGVNGTYGPQTACAESDGLCWVEVTSDTTGLCTVAPVHDRGPLFVRDNWWAPQGERTYNVPQGIPAAEYARDGANFGFGAGISDVGYDIQNVYRYAAGIDLAGGTWQAIGLPVSAGVTTVTVRMLWQAGITHDQACGGGSGSTPPPTSTGGNAATTASLNLRAQPALGSSVVTVMPAGSRVTVTGGSQNGFYPVSYGNSNGWAYGDYLAIDAGEDPGSDDPAPTTPPPTSGGPEATVIGGALNLRSGPGTNYAALTVMPGGSVVTLTGQSSGNWLSVAYQGTAGWAYGDYLSTDTGSAPPPSSGVTGTATVTGGALNLRSGAGTGYAVLTVMPGGSTVDLTGSESNGFLSVIYNGIEGWAYAAYLDTGGGSAPPPPATTGEATVTSALNLRSGAGTNYAVLTVMPAGAVVGLTGDSANGYLGLVYNGTSGWGYAQYLSTSGGNAAPTSNTATVIDGALNLRSGPGTDYSVLLVLPNGAQVTLTGQSSNGFLSVSYNGTEGWAYATFLQ